MAVGVEMEFREDLWEQVVSVIGRYGRPAENQTPTGFVPRVLSPFPIRWAPLRLSLWRSAVDAGRRKSMAIICLPGVPHEMEYLHESVIPYLQKHFDLRQVIKVRLLHTAGWAKA